MQKTTYIRIRIHIYMQKNTYIRIRIRTHNYIQLHIHAKSHLHTYTHTYIHAKNHLHTYTHTYTQLHTYMWYRHDMHIFVLLKKNGEKAGSVKRIKNTWINLNKTRCLYACLRHVRMHDCKYINPKHARMRAHTPTHTRTVTHAYTHTLAENFKVTDARW